MVDGILMSLSPQIADRLLCFWFVPVYTVFDHPGPPCSPEGTNPYLVGASIRRPIEYTFDDGLKMMIMITRGVGSESQRGSLYS
jgi:hypothetical protein